MAHPMIKKSHRGLLHKEMGIPEDEPISMSMLMREKVKAKKSGDSATMKRVTFAQNARNWKH